jgi:hypothetical protein
LIVRIDPSKQIDDLSALAGTESRAMRYRDPCGPSTPPAVAILPAAAMGDGAHGARFEAETIDLRQRQVKRCRGTRSRLALGHTLGQLDELLLRLVLLRRRAVGASVIRPAEATGKLSGTLPADIDLCGYLGESQAGMIEKMRTKTLAKLLRRKIKPGLSKGDRLRVRRNCEGNEVGGLTAHVEIVTELCFERKKNLRRGRLWMIGPAALIL